MAVSPYVSRAELWLANSSFRPTFHLPNDFHPSVFLKWFPGHMAKGLSRSAVEIIFDNTEETISKWQLIHCWYICYSFTYDATPITKMRLCNRSSWCENILFSAKICMIKVKRLYANLEYKGFHPTWSIDSYQNRASADKCHLIVPRAQVSTHRGRVFFKVIRWQITSFKWSQAQVYFFQGFIQICCVYVTMAPHY